MRRNRILNEAKGKHLMEARVHISWGNTREMRAETQLCRCGGRQDHPLGSREFWELQPEGSTQAECSKGKDTEGTGDLRMSVEIQSFFNIKYCSESGCVTPFCTMTATTEAKRESCFHTRSVSQTRTLKRERKAGGWGYIWGVKYNERLRNEFRRAANTGSRSSQIFSKGSVTEQELCLNLQWLSERKWSQTHHFRVKSRESCSIRLHLWGG